MVRFEREEGIGTIWLPSFTNLSPLLDIRDRFADICAEIEADEEVRVVIITSSEDGPGGQRSLRGELSHLLHLPLPRLRFSEAISQMDRPCICAIPGDARAVGLEIALACDIRLATEGSHFCLPYVVEGLLPWDGATQRLPRLVGQAMALELLLTGRLIDAQEAQRIGLVSRVVPRHGLLAETRRIAREMASHAPIALRFIREAVHKGMDMSLEQALRMEGDLYLLLFATEDRVEGVKAFREKRKAIFKGR
jgi:enoyl-CoA hydratase/carnithine racemase